jgi:hypothetical protein
MLVTGDLITKYFITYNRQDMEQQTFTETALLIIWEQIGLKNYWIPEAYDPPFTSKSFCKCNSVEELESYLKKGNWSLGQAFYNKNLCFINQVEGGDEWLTIKDDYAFESYTFERIIKQGTFPLYIEDFLSATKEECLQLKYKKKSR